MTRLKFGDTLVKLVPIGPSSSPHRLDLQAVDGAGNPVGEIRCTRGRRRGQRLVGEIATVTAQTWDDRRLAEELFVTMALWAERSGIPLLDAPTYVGRADRLLRDWLDSLAATIILDGWRIWGEDFRALQDSMVVRPVIAPSGELSVRLDLDGAVAGSDAARAICQRLHAWLNARHPRGCARVAVGGIGSPLRIPPMIAGETTIEVTLEVLGDVAHLRAVKSNAEVVAAAQVQIRRWRIGRVASWFYTEWERESVAHALYSCVVLWARHRGLTSLATGHDDGDPVGDLARGKWGLPPAARVATDVLADAWTNTVENLALGPGPRTADVVLRTARIAEGALAVDLDSYGMPSDLPDAVASRLGTVYARVHVGVTDWSSGRTYRAVR